jgi:uncharacterized repeat protein (TIGR03803 family)
MKPLLMYFALISSVILGKNKLPHLAWIPRTCARPTGATSLLVIVFVLAAIATPVQAQTFAVLTNFTGSSGAYPYGGLMQDSAGNLYGTTYSGGAYSAGTMFAVIYGAEPVLHSFSGSDGSIPKGGLIRDQNGVLYGTTQEGGAFGFGTVFSVSNTGSLITLYSFAGGTSDGEYPYGGLARDAYGNLYGTTESGGLFGIGTVWKLSPSGTETVMYNFSGTDGENPAYGSLTLDKTGNLYGVTAYGGASNDGVIFRITTSGSFTVLHSFTGADGSLAYGALVEDGSGNLYGTAAQGGKYGNGTVWKLNSIGALTVLHHFEAGTADGAYPLAGLARDGRGNLYGVTYYGGSSGEGTVFKVKGSTFTLLHSFNCASDGCYPVGALIEDKSGNLYGTGNVGGPLGVGTVWKITP